MSGWIDPKPETVLYDLVGKAGVAIGVAIQFVLYAGFAFLDDKYLIGISLFGIGASLFVYGVWNVLESSY